SRDMIAAIRAAGGHPRYTEYPNGQHDIWFQAYNTPELLPWMNAQRLGVEDMTDDAGVLVPHDAGADTSGDAKGTGGGGAGGASGAAGTGAGAGSAGSSGAGGATAGAAGTSGAA